MKEKTIIATFLVLMMTLSGAFVVITEMSDATTYFNISYTLDKDYYEADGDVVVTLSTSTLTNSGTIGIQFDYTFPASLTFVKLEKGQTGLNVNEYVATDVTTNTYRVVIAGSLTSYDSSRPIAKITFNADDSKDGFKFGTAQLYFNNLKGRISGTAYDGISLVNSSNVDAQYVPINIVQPITLDDNRPSNMSTAPTSGKTSGYSYYVLAGTTTDRTKFISKSNDSTPAWTANVAPTPTVTGWTSTGWAATVSGSAISTFQYDETTGRLSDGTKDITTLYAVWEQNEYTITLNDVVSTTTATTMPVASMKVKYDSTQPTYYDSNGQSIEYTAPTRNGWTFTGYYDGQSSGNQILTTNGAFVAYNVSLSTYFTQYNNQLQWTKVITNESPLTLYLHWTAIEYKITFVNQDVAPYSDASNVPAYAKVIYDTTTLTYFNSNDTQIDPYVAPSRVGYTFDGYFTSQSAGNKVILPSGSFNTADKASISVLDNISGVWTHVVGNNETYNLYLQWTVKSYNISYVNKINSVSYIVTGAMEGISNTGYTYNENLKLEPNKFVIDSSANLAFCGWTTDNTVDTAVYYDQQTIAANSLELAAKADSSSSNTITLYAIWKTPVKITLTEDLKYTSKSTTTKAMTFSITKPSDQMVINNLTLNVDKPSIITNGLDSTIAINSTAGSAQTTQPLSLTISDNNAFGQYPILLFGQSIYINNDIQYALVVESGVITIGSLINGDVDPDGTVDIFDLYEFAYGQVNDSSEYLVHMNMINDSGTYANEASFSTILSELMDYVNSVHKSNFLYAYTFGPEKLVDKHVITISHSDYTYKLGGVADHRTLVVSGSSGTLSGDTTSSTHTIDSISQSGFVLMKDVEWGSTAIVSVS